jgi:hypothetical protein
MRKRKSIILSVLVVASLSCSQPYGIVKAEEEFKEIEWKQVKSPGTASNECKPLEIPFVREGKPIKDALAIKVYRSQETLCVYAVYEHYTWNCSDTGEPITKYEKDDRPDVAFSGSGNQICPEAIAYYKNSPGCWEVNSGDGNTYYVPRG